MSSILSINAVSERPGLSQATTPSPVTAAAGQAATSQSGLKTSADGEPEKLPGTPNMDAASHAAAVKRARDAYQAALAELSKALGVQPASYRQAEAAYREYYV